ncbi:MAG TPA: hypothetical protein VK864_20715, partial [Longimicrobiales bacterium]|nr:hypothetical protein [Longimicrobiales bacterium]
MKRLGSLGCSHAKGSSITSYDSYFVAVAEDAAAFRDAWLQQKPAEISYAPPPPDAVLEEEKIIKELKIPLAPEQVRIVPV